MHSAESHCSAANAAFRKAIDIVGGQIEMAKLVGRTQGAVSKLLTSGRVLWAESVLKVEAATGVSRHDLRPDLYPREDTPAPPPAGCSQTAGGSPALLRQELGS